MNEVQAHQITISRLRYQLSLAAQYIPAHIKSKQPDQGFMLGFAIACGDESNKNEPSEINELWKALESLETSARMFLSNFYNTGEINLDLLKLLQKDEAIVYHLKYGNVNDLAWENENQA